MPLPATFDLMDFISRVFAEDLGTWRRRYLKRDDRS